MHNERISSIICHCDISSPPNEEASSSDHDETSDEPEGDGESQDKVGWQVQQTFQLICKKVVQGLFRQLMLQNTDLPVESGVSFEFSSTQKKGMMVP